MRIPGLRLLLAVAAAMAAASAGRGAGPRATFPVVLDGRARCEIRVPSDLGDPTAAAVDDFRDSIRRLTGAEIPRLPADASARSPAIRLRLDPALETDGDRPLPFDGYLIDVATDCVEIRAPRPVGLSHALYTILSDDFGCRWYQPGDLFEVLPAVDDLEIPVGWREGRPSFSFRVIGGIQGEAGRDWLRRNRFDNGVPSMPGWGFGHAASRIVSREEYAREHPEYFAWREGRRRVPGHQVWAMRQPCYSSPDVSRIGAEYVHEWFAGNPNRPQVSLSANDNDFFCRCPVCRALDEPERVYQGFPSHSDSYFRFVKAVADRVAVTDPGRTIGVLAYWPTFLPPRRIDRMPDNVVIVMTQDTCQHADPAYRDRDRRILREWTTKTDTIARYDYGCLTWLTPKYYPHVLADDLRFTHDAGVTRYYCEADTHWPHAGPGIYLASRMLWDVGGDEDEILGAMFAELYGPAAPEMAAWYAWLEEVWMTPRPGRWFLGFMNMLDEFEVWDTAAVRRARTLLARARAAAAGEPDVLARIDYIARGFEIAARLVEIHDRAHALDSAAPDLAARIDGLAVDADAALDLARREFTEANHYPAGEYRGGRFAVKRDQWLHDLRSAAAVAVATAVGNEDDRFASFAEAVADGTQPRTKGWLVAGLGADADGVARLAAIAADRPEILEEVLCVRAGTDGVARSVAEKVLAGVLDRAGPRPLLTFADRADDVGRMASFDLALRGIEPGGDGAVDAPDDAARADAWETFLRRFPAGATAREAIARGMIAVDRVEGGARGVSRFARIVTDTSVPEEIATMVERMRAEWGVWEICGPVADPSLDGIRADVAPGAGPWMAAPSPDDGGFVDLQSAWGEVDAAVGFARTWVRVAAACDAVVWIGSDDGIAAAVNERIVHRADLFRAAVVDEDRVPIRLRAGWNRIDLRIAENEGGWGWFFRLSSPDGEPLPGARFAAQSGVRL